MGLYAQAHDASTFRTLDRRDGLSQASVFAIAQDSVGFLWFGTRDGLNRYDGFDFEVFHHDGEKGSLAGNDVRVLYVDPRSKDLWVGTLSGLSRYDATANTFTSYRHVAGSVRSLPGSIIRCVYRDGAGRLWVGTSNGLGRYSEETEAFDRFYPGGADPESPGNDVTFLTEDAAGHLLIGTGSGLFRMQGEKLLPTEPFNGKALTCAEWGDNGKLYLGTATEGVLSWSPGAGTLGQLRNREGDLSSLSHDNVRSILRHPDGGLWVGTFDGLSRLLPWSDTFLRYTRNPSDRPALRDNSVHSLLVDRAGSLWVGTYYGGVHYYDERFGNFVNYQYEPHVNSLSASVVSSFAESASGDLWIGTERGGLNFYDRTTGRFRRYGAPEGEAGAVTGNNVKQLLMDDDLLWIGSWRAGLTRLDTRTGEYRRFRHRAGDPTTLAHDNVYGLFREDDLLYILTYGGGMDVMNVRSGELTHYAYVSTRPTSISSNLTRSILRRRNGRLLIGTERGLNEVIEGPDGLPAAFSRSLEQYKIYCLHEDRQGQLWVGTYSYGLVKYSAEGDSLGRYTTADGLPDDAIFGVLETDEGDLWLSTGNGLSRFDPQAEAFTNYDYNDGLKNSEYNFNAYYRTRNGEYLFGGTNGFTSFRPRDLKPNRNVPRVVFTRLLRNGEEVSVGGEDGILSRSLNHTEEITFGYDEAAFSIGFAALDYLNPENNTYAYRLEGLDRDWNYGGGISEASYIIQREGQYEFLLRGSNSDGVWNETPRRLIIRVLPPPWRSWWAYLLYTAAGVALIYALVRFIRLRHQLQLQEIAKQQQDELLEMKLRFFTNITHEFRTPLTLILGPLQQLVRRDDHAPDTGRQLSLINRNAQRLLNLVNQVLTFRKLTAEHEPMEVSRISLIPFLAEIFDSFQEQARQRGIKYSLISQSGTPEVWVDNIKMEKVFFNLLSNAFKFTPDGGQIDLIVEESEHHYQVRVRDSGQGVPPGLREEIFQRFFGETNGQQTAIKSSGIGLAICRQLVNLHQGEIYVADREVPGAEFVVELRKGKQHFVNLALDGGFLIEETEYPVAAAPVVQSGIVETTPGERRELLIVDDNAEIREYLSLLFSTQHRVRTAENGLQGLERVREQPPDLILSDVMMPGLDGVNFCRQIKSDLETSHIPVILLTARSAQPSRIEGLRNGANDYVTKPFNEDELKLRVANLLHNSRPRSASDPRHDVALEPARMNVTTLDEQFLNQLLALVEDNIAAHGYKVDHLARDLAVSRTLLFNKMKALTGLTPGNFLKQYRLKRAAQLLVDSDYNIKQIADMVGFQNARYFTDCFKQEFRVTPAKYRSIPENDSI